MDLVESTSPNSRKALRLRRYWWRLKKDLWHIQAMGLINFMKRKQQKYRRDFSSFDTFDLKPGDMVEVRSEKEIFATLDKHDKHKGLQFTKEMSKFCGRRFRVEKKVEKILIETTGELREFKIPTVILKGVICDGSSHGDCDRSCFCFWREIWLKKIDGAEES
ncbi:MAG: hypothetical protein QHH14_13055 [Clostridiales bacterium]|nr:hypothetical protein [Clostridiales bacterium]